MSAANYDFLPIVQRETWTRVLTYKDPAGAAINLTGYTAAMKIREKDSGGAAKISLVAGSGITLGGSAGTITIVVSSSQSGALEVPETPPRKDFVYELDLIAPSGAVVPLLYGLWPVLRSFTR